MSRLSLLKIIVLPVVGLLAAQVVELGTDIRDAFSILQGSSNDGFIPESEIRKVVAELAAVRMASTEINQIHDSPRYELTELIIFSSATVEYTSDKSCQLTADSRRRMKSNPVATGIRKFDELNRKFGVEQIYPDTEDGAMITFKRALDISRVLEIYKRKLGNCFQREGLIGDGDHIKRSLADDGSIFYTFTEGWGDCLAGCMHHRVHWFRLVPGTKGFRVRLEGSTST